MRMIPRNTTPEEEQRNLERFERIALADRIQVYAVCDWCTRGTREIDLPISRKVLGADERVKVGVCQRCYELWRAMSWWQRLCLWWNS